MEDLEIVIRRNAPLLAKQLRESAESRKVEAELVHDTVAQLRSFADQSGLNWDPNFERRIVFRTPDAAGQKSARADLLFNLLVVEFEPPKSLHNNNQAGSNRHALKQLREQIDGLNESEHIEKEKLSGVAIDGHRIIFCRYSQGQWLEEAPLDVDEHSATRFLRLILSLQRKPLLPKTVAERFGIDQEDTAVLTIRAFFDALASPSSMRSVALRAQWMEFYSEVAGLDVSKLSSNEQMLGFAQRVTQKKHISSDELANLLFALYTYGAVLMKLLAVSAVTPFFSNKVFEPLSDLARLDDTRNDEFRAKLKTIESGRFFRDLGIQNLCEGDFFGWYADEWTPQITRQLKTMVNVLSEYDPTVLEQTPERVRDLMKRIYHSLLPKAVRKVLGEYYTPDWLAERTLALAAPDLFATDPSEDPKARSQFIQQIAIPAMLERRFLDPTCGSGTFLVLILSRLKSLWAEARQIGNVDGQAILTTPSARELLKSLLQNVIGFDLNPLAVIASRVNYLLNIVDLLARENDEIEIPIYLADSISLPKIDKDDLFKDGVYQLPMRGIGEIFPIPSEFAERARLGSLTKLLERDVSAGVSTDAFLISCKTEFRLRNDQWERCEPSLRELYVKLDRLHREDRNGLWAAVAKNMFMPLFIEPVDLVVGNPPWVNWEGLPVAYRQGSKKLWEEMGLFVHKGMDVMLGKGKKDISTLCAYVATDRYLKHSGKLAFVITQSVLKNHGAGQGFRRFRIGNRDPLRVLVVEDYSRFQPFEDASNKTAVIVWEKGTATTFPLRNYRVWTKSGRRSPSFWADWTSAQTLLKSRDLAAEPAISSDATSSWMTAPTRVLTAAKKVLKGSNYVAHAGAYHGGLQPVFWHEVVKANQDGTFEIQMMLEGAKKEVPAPYRHTVESRWYYPLLRMGDVTKWHANIDPRRCILMMQDPIKRVGFDTAVVQQQAPRLFSYLSRFETQLRKRAAFIRYYNESDPFYSMFNTAEYTFAPWKVVWPSMGHSISACVVSKAVLPNGEEREVVPQHTLTMVGFDTAEEAHFVCAVVNSSPFNCAVKSYSQEDGKSFAGPHVLQFAQVPDYDGSPEHRRIIRLSVEAHAVAAGKAGRCLEDIEAELDKTVLKLWRLRTEDLVAMKKELSEMR